VFGVRYERWFHDPDVLLAELGRFLECDLSRPFTEVRASSNADRLDERDHQLLREHCRTASALGYEL
jgi:hypothetical protein